MNFNLDNSNLALGKSTTQSSTTSHGYSKNAVDGNLNDNWNGKSCTATNNGGGSWWRVDLGQVFWIDKVGTTFGKQSYSQSSK